MAKAKVQSQGFEESFSSLEKIVAQLEAGDLPLERALEIFEEGVGLARRCQLQLGEAERRVELLLREHGELKTIPFGESVSISAKGDNKLISRRGADPAPDEKDEKDEKDNFDDDGEGLNDNNPF
jgi:exodeoxyribonuclease VII small subunit